MSSWLLTPHVIYDLRSGRSLSLLSLSLCVCVYVSVCLSVSVYLQYYK